MKNDTNFSNIEAIDIMIRRSVDVLYSNGYEIIEKRNINYGTRFKFAKGGLILPFTVYYSEKKGISIVKDQNVNFPEYKELLDMLCKNSKLGDRSEKKFNTELGPPKSGMDLSMHSGGVNPPPDEVSFNKWIGTDEAGKGDYFGPLVVAGFVMDENIKDFIKSLGVKDSKVMSDSDVEKVLQCLESNYINNFSIKMLMPLEYNRMITSLKKDGRTLNDLLGICHSQVILELYNKHLGVEGVIVDQFTHQDKVHNLIKGRVKAEFIQRTKAESDIAVAAASVIARAVFLRQLKIMGEKYKMVFPKGASNQVINWASKFCKTYGENSLSDVAKIHFKTTNNILNMLRSKKIDEI